MVGEVQDPTQKPGPQAKVFDCPKCGAGVTVRAQGQSVTAVCGSCGSIIDLANENLRILSQVALQTRIQPLIPLGQRGKLRGDAWEVIGFMQRSDSSGAYIWSEYLLFNPFKGYRWLTEFDGHWNYVLTTREKPVLSADGNTAQFHAKSYPIFNKGKAKVTYVLGEFYWRVAVGETVWTEDFISPPQMLSKEQSATETIWSVSEYMEPGDIQKGFQLADPLPMKFGVAPNQPSTLTDISSKIMPIAGLFACAIFIIQLVTLIISKEDRIFSENYRMDPTTRGQSIVTPAFTLPDRTTTLDVRMNSPVQNNWFGAELTLLNEKTSEGHPFSLEVESYNGYDSDGSWSEGSQATSTMLSSVPEGTYHLSIEPSWPADQVTTSFHLEVWRGVVLWSNAFWAMIAITLFPLLAWLRSYTFEKSRWSQSDFSPYWKGTGDDE